MDQVSSYEALERVRLYDVAQSQESLVDQLNQIKQASIMLGLYDAHDWLCEAEKSVYRDGGKSSFPTSDPDENLFLTNEAGRDLVMCRSYGKTENGNPLGGRWAIFDIDSGEILDFDQYRNDLKERWGVA